MTVGVSLSVIWLLWNQHPHMKDSTRINARQLVTKQSVVRLINVLKATRAIWMTIKWTGWIALTEAGVKTIVRIRKKFRQNIRGSHQGYSRKNHSESYRKSRSSRQKKCFSFQKLGCLSTKNSVEECNKAATKWQHIAMSTDRLTTPYAH